MNNLISVIVPVYKVEEYLDKCVESIANQTYKNLEIILVDDGSPDNCPKMCDDWAKKDKRIKVIHKENGGVSSARNIGIEHSTGDFIAFVDGDDWIEPNMFEALIKKQAEANADLVFTRFKTIHKDWTEYWEEESLEDLCKNNDLSVLLNYSTKVERQGKISKAKDYVMAFIWRILFKSEIIKNHKFNVNIKIMEDTIFLTEIMLQKNCKADFVNEYYYNYLLREGSAMHKPNPDTLENSKNMVKEFERLLTGTKYEEYICALKFFCYGVCVAQKYSMGVKVDLSEIKQWNTRHNYKAFKKIPTNFQAKVKFFCIRHKIHFLIKILYKLKGKDD